MQGYCDVYKWTTLKRTSPEVKCLHPTSSQREMCTSSVSNVIYHKLSQGTAFYTLNGKNVNVMLEYQLNILRLTVKRLFLDVDKHLYTVTSVALATDIFFALCFCHPLLLCLLPPSR